MALAILGVGMTLALATPSLRRPLLPALALLVVLPALVAGALSLGMCVLPALRRRPRGRAFVAAFLVCLPAWAVATAPMARIPWVVGPVALLFLIAVSMRRSIGLPLVAATILCVCWPQGQITLDGEQSVVVLGFDAATLDQIDPMIEEGELPTFARFREQGAVGVLRSEPLSLSPRVWTTIATGVSPDRHGIESFSHRRHMLKAGRVWDEITANDATAGVVGWLVNWPPDPTLSFSLPGWLAVQPLTEPEEANCSVVLRTEFDAKGSVPKTLVLKAGLSALAVSSADNAWRTAIDLSYFLRSSTYGPDRYWRFRLWNARLQADLFVELLARKHPQFGALVTYPTDALAHLYWKFHEPELFPTVVEEGIRLRGEVVRDSYRTADTAIARVLSRLDLEHTTVMLVSDHGMEALPEANRILCLREGPLLEAIGARGTLRPSTFGRVLILTPLDDGPAGDEELSRARVLLEECRFVDDPDSRPFTVGASASNERTILLRMHDGVATSRHVTIDGQDHLIEDLCVPELRSGDHTLRGIVMMLGAGVQEGVTIEAVHHDVAPTVLAALGLAVPDSLPGRVLEDAFEADWRERHPVQFRSGSMAPPFRMDEMGSDEAVQARLRELGYVR